MQSSDGQDRVEALETLAAQREAERLNIGQLTPEQQQLRDKTENFFRLLLVAFGCLVVGNIFYYFLQCIHGFNTGWTNQPLYTPPPPPTEATVPDFLKFVQHDTSSELVLSILPFAIFFCLIATAIAAIAYYNLKKREIIVEDKQLVMQATGGVMMGLRWSAIKEIEQTKTYDLFNGRKDVLTIETQEGNKFKLRMSDILLRQDAATFFNKIRTNAPHANLKVDSTLKNDTNSYTELWLKYFSVPTERTNNGMLQPGMTLADGRYRILETIGGGGQGTAYLAFEQNEAEKLTEAGRVVLKEYVLPIHRGQLTADKTAAKLRSEAGILRRLDHPQIVKLLDDFVEDFRGYLVLEYVQGDTLKSILERFGSRSEIEVLDWGLQLCDILIYMHELSPPVVHRDLTPDNMILQEDGFIKIVDFNVAHQVDSSETATVVGKHAYIPPEQFRGKSTAQSDIYALGATMFYLLTGEEPVPISVAHPRNLAHTVSAEMDKVVSMATALSLDKRYQNARTLREALAELRSKYVK